MKVAWEVLAGALCEAVVDVNDVTGAWPPSAAIASRCG
jgi:hypothetical protein